MKAVSPESHRSRTKDQKGLVLVPILVYVAVEASIECSGTSKVGLSKVVVEIRWRRTVSTHWVKL